MNFRDLSGEEQAHLIAYLKKIEKTNPKRVEKLKGYVDLGEAEPEEPQEEELEPEPIPVKEKTPEKELEVQKKIPMDSEDDDDYCFEDVLKDAFQKVQEDEMKDDDFEEVEMIIREPEEKKVEPPKEDLIQNLMGSLQSSIRKPVESSQRPGPSTQPDPTPKINLVDPMTLQNPISMSSGLPAPPAQPPFISMPIPPMGIPGIPVIPSGLPGLSLPGVPTMPGLPANLFGNLAGLFGPNGIAQLLAMVQPKENQEKPTEIPQSQPQEIPAKIQEVEPRKPLEIPVKFQEPDMSFPARQRQDVPIPIPRLNLEDNRKESRDSEPADPWEAKPWQANQNSRNVQEEPGKSRDFRGDGKMDQRSGSGRNPWESRNQGNQIGSGQQNQNQQWAGGSGFSRDRGQGQVNPWDTGQRNQGDSRNFGAGSGPSRTDKESHSPWESTGSRSQNQGNQFDNQSRNQFGNFGNQNYQGNQGGFGNRAPKDQRNQWNRGGRNNR
jgi:hypothetical protein